MSGSIAALFQRLTQGVYVVGVAYGELRNAFTAAWVMQVSFDPLLLALSINPRHSWTDECPLSGVKCAPLHIQTLSFWR